MRVQHSVPWPLGPPSIGRKPEPAPVRSQARWPVRSSALAYRPRYGPYCLFVAYARHIRLCLRSPESAARSARRRLPRSAGRCDQGRVRQVMRHIFVDASIEPAASLLKIVNRGGRFVGIIRHCAPLRTIHRKPLKTSRGSWSRCGALLIIKVRYGPTKAHSSSDTSLG